MFIKKKGLRVPQDLAVVGFDKSQIYRLFLTSVAHILQPQREFGENAVDILHDMIENKSTGRSIVLKPTLVPGGSVLKD
jgi:LacI family transcriptional regulator